MNLRKGNKAAWTCKICNKKYTKDSDQLLECEYCEGHFCCKPTCLNMDEGEYSYHQRSTSMWFCSICKPKVVETLKVEKEIEKRCNEHFQKLQQQFQEMEIKIKTDISKMVDEKTNEAKISKLIDKKLEKHNINNINTDIIQREVDNVSYAGVTNKHLDTIPTRKKQSEGAGATQLNQDGAVANETYNTDSELSERLNKANNIIIFNLNEPKTNNIVERQQKDLDVVNEMIEFMQVECMEEVAVEKLSRMGARSRDYENSPRPTIVKFSNIEGKRAFLRHSYVLKQSGNENVKKASFQNDLTRKDRETELALVTERNQKNSQEEGPWKYVIRGPPGERALKKINK